LYHHHDSSGINKAGFVSHLSKPVKKKQLYNCLCRQLYENSQDNSDWNNQAKTDDSIPEENKQHTRILLAEDDITNQRVATGILNKLGYSLDIVLNGKEALELLKKRGYDLVLMDCQMPEMDGFEAVARIRNPGSGVMNHNIPVIAITANAMTGDRERCLAAGMDDYIAKPLKIGPVSDILNRWLLKNTALKDVQPEAVKTSVDPVFEKEVFMTRLGFDYELAESIISGFLEDIPGQIEILKALIDQNESELAGYQAHRIKGAAASIEGKALRAKAYEMEKAGKAGDLEGLKRHFPEIKKQFETLKKRMLSMLQLIKSE
jgi:CheY-like chemotaxis protein